MSESTPSRDQADAPANQPQAGTAAPQAPAYNPSAKQKAEAKTARIPIKIVPAGEVLKKPDWIRVKAGSPSTRFYEIKQILREHKLHTVYEEASCPNIGECFGKGTATFMIMGDKCTRRCQFCDVGEGRVGLLADAPDLPGAPTRQHRGADRLGRPAGSRGPSAAAAPARARRGDADRRGVRLVSGRHPAAAPHPAR